MPDTLNAAALRRGAMQCAAKADDKGVSAQERERYLTMREALLVLADNADWLAGPVPA
ncbi:MAG: hypothetical protein P8Y53_03715 [Pseudolabrys sp.]|jgi:hypothetical protein